MQGLSRFSASGSSGFPKTFSIDHSRPSGLADANHDSAPPVNRATTNKPTSTFLIETSAERGRADDTLSKYLRPCGPDEIDHACSHKPFDQADTKMNRLHHHNERTEWKLAPAGQHRLKDHGKSPQLERDHCRLSAAAITILFGVLPALTSGL